VFIFSEMRKHVIPAAELVVLFGSSTAGKTFMAIDLAMAIALGHDWRDQYIVKQGAVVYVAAEGASGVQDRLRAYCEHHQLDMTRVPLRVVRVAPNLLLRAEALELAKAIGPGIAMIVLDTFAQTMPGGNENSAEDVGLALAHCKGLRRATGAVVLLVHHSGKDESKGARGWSGLRAAADAELEVISDGERRLMRITKQKDGRDDLEFGFSLLSVGLELDEDGDMVESCVIDHTGLPPEKPAKPLRKGLAWISMLGSRPNSAPVFYADYALMRSVWFCHQGALGIRA